LARGLSLVNQTTLNTFVLGSFKVPFSVKEKGWYRIKTTLYPGGNMAVAINDVQIFNESIPKYGGSAPLSGAFGFGA
jgi:hypothetical protein